tara:strand:- start:624 stop:1172 length:549 start_codon:yes stop_codon:yes gene_type:complete
VVNRLNKRKAMLVIVGLMIVLLVMGMTIARPKADKVKKDKQIDSGKRTSIINHANKFRSGKCLEVNSTTGDCTSYLNNLTNIEVSIFDPKCYDNQCHFHAYLQGVINTNFKIPMSFVNCTVSNETTGSCITQVVINYTNAEIRDLADEHVKDKLDRYGSTLSGRASSRLVKEIGGDLTISDS